MFNLPKIKKTVKSFLLDETGKISKRSLLELGIIVGAVSLFSQETEGYYCYCNRDLEMHGQCLLRDGFDWIANPVGNHSRNVIAHGSHSDSDKGMWDNHGSGHCNDSKTVSVPNFNQHQHNLAIAYASETVTGTHTHNLAGCSSDSNLHGSWSDHCSDPSGSSCGHWNSNCESGNARAAQ